VGAIRKQALGAELRSSCLDEPLYYYALEHRAVGHLWLGIPPRFARRKDRSFGVLVLGETCPKRDGSQLSTRMMNNFVPPGGKLIYRMIAGVERPRRKR